MNLTNSWVEVQSEALKQNAQAVLKIIQPQSGPSPYLMAVVKANGYGHDSVIAAKAFLEGGAVWFGVTSVSEGMRLVDAGIDSSATPILVFAPPAMPEQAELAVRHNLHLTVCDQEHVQIVASAAATSGVSAKVHLKVDTGMSRLGLTPDEAMKVAETIVRSQSLNLAGVYTHFASASEESLQRTRKQLSIFTAFCSRLNQDDISGFVRHCANSSALIRLPESRLDMVRAGTILYGQRPSQSVPQIEGLRADTWSLKSRVIFVHDLPTGAEVGYGAEKKVTRPTRAAVLAVGFADGFAMQPASLTSGLRGLKSWVSNVLAKNTLFVAFGQYRAPLLGRVAMQMIVVDVTDAPQPIKLGDIATIPARRLAVESAIPRIEI